MNMRQAIKQIIAEFDNNTHVMAKEIINLRSAANAEQREKRISKMERSQPCHEVDWEPIGFGISSGSW